jgi:hypothetical protein
MHSKRQQRGPDSILDRLLIGIMLFDILGMVQILHKLSVIVASERKLVVVVRRNVN